MGPRRRFVLLEACLVLSVLLGGLIGAVVGAVRGGLGGVLPGTLEGLLLGAAPVGLAVAVALLERWRHPPPPAWPRCFRGPCAREADFRRAPEEDLPRALPRWRCACGELYARDHERILRVVGGDVELPWAHRNEHGAWVSGRVPR